MVSGDKSDQGLFCGFTPCKPLSCDIMHAQRDCGASCKPTHHGRWIHYWEPVQGHGEGLHLNSWGAYVQVQFCWETWLRRPLFFVRVMSAPQTRGVDLKSPLAAKSSLIFGKCFSYFSYVHTGEFRTSGANLHLKKNFHTVFSNEQRILLVTAQSTMIMTIFKPSLCTRTTAQWRCHCYSYYLPQG